MNKDDKNKTKMERTASYYLLVFLFIFLLNWFIIPKMLQNQVQLSTYKDFLENVEAGNVKFVEIQDEEIRYQIEKDGRNYFYKTGFMDDPEIINKLMEKNVEFTKIIPEKPNLFLGIILSYILPIIIFTMIGRRLFSRMDGRIGASGLNIGSGKAAKIYEPDKDKKTFEDVAGQEEAKESLMEIIDYLNNPKKYEEIGAQCPKGVLLVGPPGTGKTLMAKAVAGEAEVPFFSISGSEFVEMFVGRGAAKVRDLFDQASKHAPCIVFIDEIDTIGKKRDSSFTSNDEREQTLNQLLTEMDGFESNKGVIILAATNRPDVLDPALLRPGRFDRHVNMELPDLKGRIEILKVHLRKVKTEGEIDYNFVSRMTAGASGAQVANIVNEAALRAVRTGRSAVTTDDLVESIETVIAGQQKKNTVLSPKEKEVVAYHEIGHALVAAMQTGSAPVEKITIIPRTSGALGYTMQVEPDEKFLMTKTDAIQKIEVLCGGRAAEEVVFDCITTGAANDIEKATKLAREMVTKYGMSDKFGMMSLETSSNQYLGGDSSVTCSSETRKLIDEEVLKIIKDAQESARNILTENRDKMDRAARFLIEKETITGKEFMEAIRDE
ncbi:MAG: ATP-dependent zinc metalloprotease FtsH [Tissierellia bacterium]|nr:ATP-dependent zinc metalloprotease FtsH [Tissierellia bacterium]